MQTQNKTQDVDLTRSDGDKYVPSSSDKKRAVMMYLFLGIMVWLTKKDLNSFEYYHLKQAAGRWIIFLFVLVFDAVLLFIPVIKYLGLIPLIALIVLWVLSAKQSRDGKYFINKSDSPLALFSWVGGWFLDLFEIGINIPETNNSIDIDSVQNDTIQSDIELDINKNKLNQNKKTD